MKKCYIAVGGICCRVLKQYEQSHGNQNTRYFYFDTDQKNDVLFDTSDTRIMFQDYPYKSGYMRCFGKDMFKSYLYTGRIPVFLMSFLKQMNWSSAS